MWSYLGQNFLIDTKVQSYIADKIEKIYKQNSLQAIVEIWPGKWAISKKIFGISPKFFVIEKDEKMSWHLEKILNSEQIFFTDVLEFDLLNLLDSKNIDAQKTLIVWNLPYYITSPIFRKIFGNGDQNFFGGFFMVQDEVWQKIKTDATKKSFLWWVLNYSYDIKYCKKVGPKSFNPAPKVNSCLLEFSAKREIVDLNFDDLLVFLDLYSPFSRKTLWAIDKILKKQNKYTFSIPDNLLKKRLEELSWENLNFLKN